MIIQTLTYKTQNGDGETATHSLGGMAHALHCADVNAARNLSRLLHRILAARAVYNASPPIQIATEMPGCGALTATLAAEPDDAQHHYSLSLAADDETPEPIGADLLLLSLHEMLEEDYDYARIAREMAAIVDTGNSQHDLIAALARLDAFTARVGRDSDGNTPLARARVRLASLKKEYEAAESALRQVREHARSLETLRDQVDACRHEYDQTERRLGASVLGQLADSLERLEALERDIEAARSGKCLDSDEAAAIQRAETQTETARLQVERTREELRAITEEIEALRGVIANRTEMSDGAPEEMEQLQRHIQSGQGRITEFNARLDEVNNQIGTLDAQIAEAQEQLTALPDFSRIAPNPTDWLNQLARSFKTALGVRDAEEETRDALREELANLRVEIAGDAAIFESSANFAEELLAHQNARQHWETRSTQIGEEIRQKRSQHDEQVASMPGLFLLSLGCALFLSLLLGAYVGLQKAPILIPAFLMLLSILYFLTQLLLTRARVMRLARSIDKCQSELDMMGSGEQGEVSQIDRLMTRADCGTARELEARYDRYRELRAKIEELETRFAQQEEHLRESEERIPKLFERVRSTLEQVEEPPEDEDDIENAVGRAIAKYQVYRETKRRLADLRNQHQGLLGRRRFLERELATTRESLPETEKQLREIMRNNGFADEGDYRDINAALTAYYRYLDAIEENTGRVNTLTRTLQSLEARLPEEEAALATFTSTLEALLAHAQFDSPDEARAAAANTMALRDMEREKATIEQQQESVLQGRPVQVWHKLAGDAVIDDDDRGPEHYARELEAIRQQREDALQQYRALFQKRQQALAAHKPLCEIAEDMAALEQHIATLRRDVSAAAHAGALTEESLRTWRARHSSAIAERASEILAVLGIDARMRLDLDPNDAPSLEAAVENDHAAATPAVLSLALRFAAAEMLVGGDGAPPLIVDATLQGAPLPAPPEKFVAAIKEIATSRQVLLVFEDDAIADAVSKLEMQKTSF